MSWAYDADGRRTSMTTPDGKTTHYGCDAAGRLSWIEHPDVGRACFERDGTGRLTAATAADIRQSWRHRDGLVVGHTVADASGERQTLIERDDTGRVLAVTRDGSRTRYAFDGACQLVEAGSMSWGYDSGGRLVSERSADRVVEHTYDLAGQVLRTRDDQGRSVSYAYDGLGRRVRQDDSDGGGREFVWSVTGHLAEVIDRQGGRTSRRRLQTDALGELAAVDGTELFWDSAGVAGAPVLVGGASVVAGGAVTGIGGDWMAPGWRTARSAGVDPWSVAAGQSAGGVFVGPSGEVQIAGLEWMGARTYDPVSRGFLSVDPLDSVAGVGWSANPYAYAGNDPLHALDPLGLTPVTDADLNEYGATMNRGGRWLAANGEYLTGAGMIAGGVLLCATGLGGPLGMMSISAGADTIIQKATTGTVDWREVALMGASGGIGLGAGIGARALFGTVMRGRLLAGLAAGTSDGAVSSGGLYLLSEGEHTPTGLARAAANGALVAVAFAGIPGLAGLFRSAGRHLGTTSRSLRGAHDLMGSFLANGSTVHHSRTATAVGDDFATLSNFRKSRGRSGRHDVIVHGGRAGLPEVDGWPVHPGQIAQAVLENPAYHSGQPIRLVMCHGAKEAMVVLSGELGVPVLASQYRVRLNALGYLESEFR